MRRAAAAATLAVAICVAGCGGPRPAAAPSGVLPVSAVRYLPSATSRLTALDVQKNSSLHDLTARLRRWGYTGGWQRTFQGESRRLTLVVSQSLMFRTQAGAEAFVTYLTRHLGAFYPYAIRRPLTLPGQAGWLIKPPLCACHLAEPVYVGVTVAGSRVHWLEINGPAATGTLLAAMLGQHGR
jgi:hypothetical protein